MLVVTGATGALGRAIVQQLLTRVPASEIVASVRDPEKARDLAERGVAVRRGDFTDAESLAQAFEGAATVLVVSVMAHGAAARQQHRTAIEAARAAGARRIVYTSQMGSNPASPFPPMPDHAATEEVLRASGVPFTALRNGFYAASAAALFGAGLRAGEVVAPEDGPVAWTAHRDLAEAAAIAMTTDRLDGVTPPLTAARALDLAQLAALASAATGRPVRRVVVSDDDYRASLLAKGFPAHAADLLVGMFAASRLGHFARVDPMLARLLDRPPLSVGDTLAL